MKGCTDHDLLFYSIVNRQACENQEKDDTAPLLSIKYMYSSVMKL